MVAMYRLTEPFYDNLVLWDEGDEIPFEGTPSPSMIPLNEEAEKALVAYHKERGITDYVPPLSEIPDTMDGRVTVQAFAPGNRAKKADNRPPFPATPGKPGAQYTKPAPMAVMPQMPVKPTKNFDRAPK